MSDVSRVSRGVGIGAFGLLLVATWIAHGCARKDGGVRMLLDDPPIRVKNQKLEIELLGDDEWQEDGSKFKPKVKVKKSDYFTVIALKYDGTWCTGQPFLADTVTIEYGPQSGDLKKTATLEVKNKKITVDFPGASGKGKKKLEYAGSASDYLRRVRATNQSGGSFECPADAQTDNMLVYVF
jgi:hypothetical protein